MNDILGVNSIFIYISIWGVGILLVWLKGRIEINWKVVATLIYVFIIFLFFDEVERGYDRFMAGWYVNVIHFFKEFVFYLSYSLFFLWPLSLFIIFYKSDDVASESLLKFMSIFSLVLIIFIISYAYHSKGIDKFLFENLRKMFQSGA